MMDEIGIPGVPHISAFDLKDRMMTGEKMVFLDVRETFEIEMADFPDVGPYRIPVGELQERWTELDKDTFLVVFCRTGSRSAWAVQFLQAKGFEKLTNLRGGLMGWREDIDPSIPIY